ncbi:MAG: TonB-dependent receptor [Calditrichaeota bacterium]|nr:TonB-dependent receptor [Calditrichota bacterium]
MLNIAVTLICASFLFAQTGKISGVVKDKTSGEALPGVNVIVEGTSLGASTDVDGFYVILNVPVGRHDVRFSYVGYSDLRVNDVIVNIDNTATLNAELSEEVNVGEVVVVTAQRELIRRAETNSRQIKNSEEIKNMPITSVQDVVALTSGVVRRGNSNDVNVRGGRTEDSAVIIDGVTTNSSTDGTSRARLNKNAIEEVTVQSGGFGAEFGGVMSGLIQTTTKTGSSKYNVVFELAADGSGSERGDKFLGSKVNGYRNYNLSIGGPIIPGTNNHFFFLSIDKLVQQDDSPSWGGEAIGSDYTNKSSENDALNIVFNYKANIGESMSIRFGGTGDWSTNTPYIHNRSFFGDKAGHYRTYETKNFTSNLTFTHTLNKNTYYNFRFGMLLYDRIEGDNRYGTSFIKYGDAELNQFSGDETDLSTAKMYGLLEEDGDLAQDPGTLTGFVDEYGTEDYRLRRVFAVNRVWNQWGKDFEKNWDVSADFFTKLDKHQIKFGAGYKAHELRKWFVQPAGLNKDGQISNKFSNWRNNVFSNYYGYDIKGNWVDEGDYKNGNMVEADPINNPGVYIESFDLPDSLSSHGSEAPRTPKSFWFYASDEWVNDDFILTFGLRVDYFDPNWINLINPLDPVSGGFNSKEFDPGDYTKSKTFTEIQPRLGFAFPVDENTKFSANISRFVQMPAFQRMYTSYYELWDETRGSGNTFNNPNLKPEENISYEISIAHQLSTDVVFNMRTYYRSIKNLVQVQRINSTNELLNYYITYGNIDYADSKGLELSIETRRINNLRLFANYTYSNASGTGSTSNSNNRNATDDSQEFVKFATDLEHDVPHQLNANIDYRFFDGEGPAVFGTKPFQNFGLNLIYKLQSGRPYTERKILNSFREIDTRYAEIGSGVNQERLPTISSFDLRLDKSFPLNFGETNVNLNIYVDIQNLFNQENVIRVQRSTGLPNEDGYLATAASQNDVETNNNYKRNSYRYLLNDPDRWDAPRVMRFGLRLEF